VFDLLAIGTFIFWR